MSFATLLDTFSSLLSPFSTIACSHITRKQASPMDKAQKALILRCKSRRIDSSRPLPLLPLEVVHHIASYLAQLGSRSAVTAKLVHPSFSNLSYSVREQGELVVGVDKMTDIQRAMERMQSFSSDQDIADELFRYVPCVNLTLRIHWRAPEKSQDRESEKWKEVSTLLERIKMPCGTLEVNDLSCAHHIHLVKRLTIMDPSQLSPAFARRIDLISLEEVTLMEPYDKDITALRQLRLKRLYLFYEAHDMYQPPKSMRGRCHVKFFALDKWQPWTGAVQAKYEKSKKSCDLPRESRALAVLRQLVVQEIHLVTFDIRDVDGRLGEPELFSKPHSPLVSSWERSIAVHLSYYMNSDWHSK